MWLWRTRLDDVATKSEPIDDRRTTTGPTLKETSSDQSDQRSRTAAMALAS